MPRRNGFTLIELLVSIAVFAVLAALSWQVFDYLVKTKAGNQRHEANIIQLQDAYQQVMRDSVQIVPITAHIQEEFQPALVLQNGRFNFSKMGVIDPLQQGKAPDERIEYQYNSQEKTVYRLQYRQLHQDGQLQPERSVLLQNVEQFEVLVLNPEEKNAWPDPSVELTAYERQRLPRGFKIQFQQQQLTYTWIFSLLNTDYLRPSTSGELM